MRSISISLKALMFLGVFCSMLLAQLPDPFDPLYDFEKQILHPEQAKALHVRSCKTYVNGEMVKEHVYDNEGQVIFNGQNKFRHSYNNRGYPTYTYQCDEKNKRIASTDIDILHNGNFDEIMTEYEHYQSFHKSLFSYDDNVLKVIDSRSFNSEEQELVDTKTEYFYEENGALQARRITSGFFRMPAGQQFKKDQYIDYYIDGHLDHRERLIQYDDGSNQKEDIMFEYDSKGQLIKTQRSIDGSEYQDHQSYSYYPDGLIKSYTVQNTTYEYQYDFMKVATVNIEILDEFRDADLYKFSGYNAWKELEFIDHKTRVEIFIPGLEFYMLSILLPNYHDYDYPIALEPGKTVNVSFKNGKIAKIDNDPINKIIWQIEDRARAEASLLNVSNHHTLVRKLAAKVFLVNKENPAFIYYSSRYALEHYIYDLRDHSETSLNTLEYLMGDLLIDPHDPDLRSKYLFDEILQYNRSMIEKYPLNALVLSF